MINIEFGGARKAIEIHESLWSRFKKLFEHHRAERYVAKVPVDLRQAWGTPVPGSKSGAVDLQHAKGVTRDLSASGVYFETDLKFEKGSLIRFKIDFDTPVLGNKTQLECTGRIVRVDTHDGGKVGVAVKLDEQHLRTVTV